MTSQPDAAEPKLRRFHLPQVAFSCYNGLARLCQCESDLVQVLTMVREAMTPVAIEPQQWPSALDHANQDIPELSIAQSIARFGGAPFLENL